MYLESIELCYVNVNETSVIINKKKKTHKNKTKLYGFFFRWNPIKNHDSSRFFMDNWIFVLFTKLHSKIFCPFECFPHENGAHFVSHIPWSLPHRFLYFNFYLHKQGKWRQNCWNFWWDEGMNESEKIV